MDSTECVRQFLNEMWNAKLDAIDDLHSIFAPRLIAYSPLGKKIGTKGMKDTNIHWARAFPDMQLSDINVANNGNMVVAEWKSEGRHLDVFNGTDATDKKVSYIGTTSFYFEKDKVIRYQCSIDLLSIYKQLGFFLKPERYDNQHVIQQDYYLLIRTLEHPIEYCDSLSESELKCLSFFLHGYSAKTIAIRFNCSFRTVQNHIGSAMDKLDSHSRHALLELFVYSGLLPVLYDLMQLLASKANRVVLW